MPNIKLKSIIAALDEAPETFRGHYVERDGMFHLDEFEIEDTSGLKSALAEAGAQLKAARAELRTFKLDRVVRSAALHAGVLEEDIDDVMMLTRDRFDLRESGIVVLDEDGSETSLTPEKFFSETYKALRPVYYTPAAAANAVTSAGSEKVVARSAFEQLSPSEQMSFMKNGGHLTDSSRNPAVGLATGEKQVRRAAFDRMTPAEQMAAVKGGAVIVD